jgi:hypothetical protein
MVVDHVIPEIHYLNPEMHFSAFMYFWNYMADGHVILETYFTEMLLVVMLELHGHQPCKSGNTLCSSGNVSFCIYVLPELHG